MIGDKSRYCRSRNVVKRSLTYFVYLKLVERLLNIVHLLYTGLYYDTVIMTAPMERIQILDAIEKDIITCLQSAGMIY